MTFRVIAFAVYVGLVKSANDTLPSIDTSSTSWRTEPATNNETSTSLLGATAPSNGTLTPATGQPTISASANTEAQTTRPIDSSPLIDSSTTAPSSGTASAASNDTYGLNATSTAAKWTSLRTESMATATSPALHSAAASGTATTTPTAAGRPTNSSTAAETAASSTAAGATAAVDEPRPVAEWTRIINAPAAFVESTAYNVTCIGTPNVARWLIGRSTATQPGTRISRWLFTNTLSIVAQRRMHNWTLSCIGGNVTADENNTLVMRVWWGPSFGGARRTVQILPYSDATYLATCGGLSGNPPLRYEWQTASGLRQPFNGSASIAFVNPTTTNATGQPDRVMIQIQDDFGMSYLSVPVLLLLPLPIGSGTAAARVAAESRASCRAWNPASGAIDRVDVVLKTSRPGSLSYSGIRPQASYTVGQTIAVSCTVRSTLVQTIGIRRGFLGEHEVVSCATNTPLLRGVGRLPGRTRASVSLRVGVSPPPQAAAAASETTAADDGADAYAPYVATSSTASAGLSPAAAGYNRPVTCGDVPWHSADGFTLTFTLYDVDAALTGPYQCYAVDEQPYYYAYVSPALYVDTTTTRTASEEAPLVSDFFFFSIYDVPSIPRIFVQRALVEGERQDVTCSSSGDNPAPSLRWTLVSGSESVSVYQLDSSVTLVARRQSHSSILRVSFVASRRMDGNILRCSIEGHPLGFSYQNVAVIRVVYGPTMADSNRSGVVIRRPLWEPLWLPCRVDSKPPAVIWWYMRSSSGSVSTIPRDYYQSSQGVILEVPYAYREPGQVAYICRAFNLESRKTSDLEVSVVWVQRDGGSPNDGSTTEGGDGGAYGPFGPPAATKRPPNASPQKVLIYVVIPIVTLASVLLAFVCAIACLLSRRPSDVFLVEKGIGDDRGGRGAGGHAAAQHHVGIPPPPGHGRYPVVPNANGGHKPGSVHRPAKSAGQNEAVGTGVSPTGGTNPVRGGATAAPADRRASPKAHKRKATHHGDDKQPAVKIRTARTAAGGNDGGRSPERNRLASVRQRDGTQRTPLAAAVKPEAASPIRGQHRVKAAARQTIGLGPQSAHAKEKAGAVTEAGLAKNDRKRESRERVGKKQASSSPHSKKKRHEQDGSAKPRKAVETGSLAQGDEAATAVAAPVEHAAALPNEEQAAHSLAAVRSAKDRPRRTLAKIRRDGDDANRAQRRAAEPEAAAAVARQQHSSPPAAEGHQPVAAAREVAAEERKAKVAAMPTVAPEGTGAIGTAVLSGDKRADAVGGGSAKRSPRKGRQQRAVTYSPAIAAGVTTVA